MLPDPNYEELLYRLALTFVKDIGPKRARALLQHFGAASSVFKASLKELRHIDGLGEVRAKAFHDAEVLQKAEAELKFISKHSIEALWIENENYPERLKNCVDAPALLFYKGGATVNPVKAVAVIGTRKNTDYGQRLTESLIKDLQDIPDITIISGLAYGIDAIAHKQAVQSGLPTIGVLGHGLDRIYPASNQSLANSMLENGGWLSEFPSGTKPDKSNFPMRNRIVAGISDVTIVVESDIKGGALITARIADSYNRDVAAFPGRIHDAKSSGCNELIRTHVATMITGAEDLLDLMSWNEKLKVPKQKQLFVQLSDEEQKVYDVLKQKDSTHTDDISFATKMNGSQLAAILLQMEMSGYIKALPGKHYRLD